MLTHICLNEDLEVTAVYSTPEYTTFTLIDPATGVTYDVTAQSTPRPDNATVTRSPVVPAGSRDVNDNPAAGPDGLDWPHIGGEEEPPF